MEAVLTRPLARPATTSKARWAGLAASGLAAAFLLFDTALKVFNTGAAVEATTQLGYPASTIVIIGVIELVCLVTYLVPRFVFVGAILLTGYLGGAVATHLRVENPLFSHTIFPLYVAALIWGGLYLRDGRLRALFAPRS